MDKKKNRTITVKENNEIVYEGEDKRYYNRDYSKFAFGVPIMDFIKLSIYIGGVLIFLVKADLRIKALEENQNKLTTLSDSFLQYMQESDGWHSSVIGTQFKGGRPIDGAFKHNELDVKFKGKPTR